MDDLEKLQAQLLAQNQRLTAKAQKSQARTEKLPKSKGLKRLLKKVRS